MNRRINKLGITLWVAFILGIIGILIGLYNVAILPETQLYDSNATWLMLNPVYLTAAWPMLIGNVIGVVAGVLIFVFGLGEIFYESPTPEEVKAYQDLMFSKGFTFEQADNYLKKKEST